MGPRVRTGEESKDLSSHGSHFVLLETLKSSVIKVLPSVMTLDLSTA